MTDDELREQIAARQAERWNKMPAQQKLEIDQGMARAEQRTADILGPAIWNRDTSAV